MYYHKNQETAQKYNSTCTQQTPKPMEYTQSQAQIAALSLSYTSTWTAQLWTHDIRIRDT